MRSLFERLDLHTADAVYVDPEMRVPYVAIEEVNTKMGILLFTEKIKQHSELFSTRCYSGVTGNVHVKHIDNWASPSISKVSLHFSIETDEAWESFVVHFKSNIETDICRIQCRTTSTKKSHTWDTSVALRLHFHTKLNVLDCLDEVSSLLNYFNYIGMPLKIKRIHFLGDVRAIYERQITKWPPRIRVKYINSDVMASIKNYVAWSSCYRPAERHYDGFVRALKSLSNQTCDWDVAMWLDKSFDWFEGTYRSIARCEFPEKKGNPLPSKLQKYKGECEPLYVSDIAMLIKQYDVNSTLELTPPLHEIPLGILNALGLSDISPVKQRLHLARILRNNSHHTLTRYSAHNNLEIPASIYIALTAFMFNFTWLMLTRRLNIAVFDKCYILGENLEEYDWAFSVHPGSSYMDVQK
jgi:hypothetical protein